MASFQHPILTHNLDFKSNPLHRHGVQWNILNLVVCKLVKLLINESDNCGKLNVLDYKNEGYLETDESPDTAA